MEFHKIILKNQLHFFNFVANLLIYFPLKIFLNLNHLQYALKISQSNYYNQCLKAF